jgi:hypothetical protein
MTKWAVNRKREEQEQKLEQIVEEKPQIDLAMPSMEDGYDEAYYMKQKQEEEQIKKESQKIKIQNYGEQEESQDDFRIPAMHDDNIQSNQNNKDKINLMETMRDDEEYIENKNTNLEIKIECLNTNYFKKINLQINENEQATYFIGRHMNEKEKDIIILPGSILLKGVVYNKQTKMDGSYISYDHAILKLINTDGKLNIEYLNLGRNGSTIINGTCMKDVLEIKENGKEYEIEDLAKYNLGDLVKLSKRELNNYIEDLQNYYEKYKNSDIGYHKKPHSKIKEIFDLDANEKALLNSNSDIIIDKISKNKLEDKIFKHTYYQISFEIIGDLNE